MIKFIKDEKIPDDLFELIGHHGATDFATAITSTPINIILALNNISDEEADALISGAFEMGISIINDVPFLTFMFDFGMSFDTIIYSMESKDENENALNIIVVDSSDYTFKGGRVLGIEKELMKIAINGVKHISYSREIEPIKQFEIYENFSTADIHKQSLAKQGFTIANHKTIEKK